MQRAQLSDAFGWKRVRIAGAAIEALIGPSLREPETDEGAHASISWMAALCLVASIAVLLVALGHGAGRREEASSAFLFWSGVILLLAPIVSRVLWPPVSRGERLFLVLLLSEGLIFLKLLYAPTYFAQFDELLHLVTADDIMRYRQLFSHNSLLPVSPYYPGIEIITTAFANLTGLNTFVSANIVLAVLRAVFVLGLFLFVERVSASSRIGALACLAYMGCPNFMIFDAMFAYESLGIVLGVLVILVEADAAGRNLPAAAPHLVLTVMLVAGLAITHHVSAIFFAMYLVGLVFVEILRKDPRTPLLKRIGITSIIAVVAIVLPVAWMDVTGAKLTGYFGPVLQSGLTELMAKLKGTSAPREMFVAADGKAQPILYRLAGMGSVLFIALGLSAGFFRSLAISLRSRAMSGWHAIGAIIRRRWDDSRVVVLTLAAFGFPVSVAFRLTSSGWEIGNRMNAFVFIGVGFVVAVGLVHFWQARAVRWNAFATSFAMTVILLGALTTSSAGRPLRGPYLVGADSQSIEAMGIETARWTREWLGEGNRFAADRTNSTLLGVHGHQDIVNSLDEGVEISRAFLAEKISPDNLFPLKRGKVEFLLVDLRLTTAPAALGEYFERNEIGHGKPPPPRYLLKFGALDRVARIYDNGWLVIFDIRQLTDGE